MAKELVFFHRADFDGVCSAAICRKFLQDCELHGIDYGDLFPWEKVVDGPAVTAKELDAGAPLPKRKVYMVDFSLPPEDMKRLAEVSDLVWIDHHKVALHDCSDLVVSGVRSTALAGCELTWEWFAAMAAGDRSLPVPEAVRLLGRYDVWDEKNPDWARIESFQFGLRSLRGAMDPADPMWKERFLSESDDVNLFNIATTVERGLGILSYRDQEAKGLCADAHVEYLFPPGGPFKNQWANRGMSEAWTAICLNTLQRGSWLFKSVWDPAKHDVMCVYGKLKNKRWRVSLYSTKPEVDCGAICKAFGGGGHKGAAGFVADSLPWSDVPPAINGDRA